MTADCIVSEIETESHYIPFKCVQCGVSGFVERTHNPRIRCSIKCNNKAKAEKTKAETAKRRADRKAEAEKLKASKPAQTEKTCSTCGQTKPVSEFHKKSSRSPDGYSSQCKVCRSESILMSISRPGAREKKSEYMKNKIMQDAEFRKNRLSTQKQYRVKNKYNPNHILYNRIKSWMHLHFKNDIKSKKWSKILGYTPDELKAHIEKQFTKGMSWKNKGDWHIDHIVPVSSFKLTGIDDPNFHSCFGLHNLRPMWAKDNMAKSNKMLFLL